MRFYFKHLDFAKGDMLIIHAVGASLKITNNNASLLINKWITTYMRCIIEFESDDQLTATGFSIDLKYTMNQQMCKYNYLIPSSSNAGSYYKQ